MCQMNTFMYKESELDGEKVMGLVNVFSSAGFTNFYEYNNPKLRNIRRDLRLFLCGNICDCGSVVTKKVKVDENAETDEAQKLIGIIKNSLKLVDTVYLFAHWYKNNMAVAIEKVNLERAPKKIKADDLSEDVLRGLFYNEVLEVSN